MLKRMMIVAVMIGLVALATTALADPLVLQGDVDVLDHYELIWGPDPADPDGDPIVVGTTPIFRPIDGTVGGAATSVVHQDGTNVTFNFGDPAGDGSAPELTGGLDLQNHTLQRHYTRVAELGWEYDSGYLHGREFRLNLNGAPITGGPDSVLRTFGSGYVHTANLVVENAGPIDVGTISTAVSGTAHAGSIDISHWGNFTVGTLDASTNHSDRYTDGFRIHGGGSGSFYADTIRIDCAAVQGYGINIEYYDQVTVGTTFYAVARGNHSFSAEDVVIQNIGAGGVWLPTVEINYNHTGQRHASSLFIDTTGPVTVDGDVNTFKAGTHSSARAGDVTINAGGDIEITGIIDASQGNNPGSIALTAGGKVLLGSLDLEKVGDVHISAGSGVSEILAELDFFDTDYVSGTGTLADPFVTTQTQLRLPEGQMLFYHYGSLNDYLGGHVWQLADLEGIAGAGGLLMEHFTPPIPEPAGLSLLGLALLGLKRRKRS